MFEAVLKNPHSHSAAGEESHIFLFKSKNQKRDPSDLRPQDDGKASLQKFWNILDDVLKILKIWHTTFCICDKNAILRSLSFCRR
jgi:hypothetical protein